MLIDHIDAYLRRTRTSPTRFGRDAVGDPNFVEDLREGRMPRPKTERRVIAFIRARDPEAVAGPERAA